MDPPLHLLLADSESEDEAASETFSIRDHVDGTLRKNGMQTWLSGTTQPQVQERVEQLIDDNLLSGQFAGLPSKGQDGVDCNMSHIEKILPKTVKSARQFYRQLVDGNKNLFYITQGYQEIDPSDGNNLPFSVQYEGPMGPTKMKGSSADQCFDPDHSAKDKIVRVTLSQPQMKAFQDNEMFGELSKVTQMNKLYSRDPVNDGYVISYHNNHTHNIVYMGDNKKLKDTNWHRETRQLQKVKLANDQTRTVEFSRKMSEIKCEDDFILYLIYLMFGSHCFVGASQKGFLAMYKIYAREVGILGGTDDMESPEGKVKVHLYITSSKSSGLLLIVISFLCFSQTPIRVRTVMGQRRPR